MSFAVLDFIRPRYTERGKRTCPVCGVSGWGDWLDVHMMRGEHVPCDKCPRWFFRSAGLKRHKHRLHALL